MLCFLWISDFQVPVTWRWLGWVNGRTDVCVLGKRLGNMGSQYFSDLCTFASITSTTLPSFIGEVLDGLFLEHDHVEASSLVSLLFWSLDLVRNSVWSRPVTPPLVLEVMGLSLSGKPLWVGDLSSLAYQLSCGKVHAQTVGSLVILFYQAK